MKTERRSALKKMFASVLGIAGAGVAAKAAVASREEKEADSITSFQNAPLFSGHTKFGNLVFVAGKGAHVEPFTIKAHTEIVLKELRNINYNNSCPSCRPLPPVRGALRFISPPWGI